MTLQDLGYHAQLEDYQNQNALEGFAIARIIAVHKERYISKNETAEYDAELVGNLRFTAERPADFPVIGDWVAISEYDENKALIHHIFPRTSCIERKAIARAGDKQIIAANIDVGLIVQAVGRDFSINRLERYLTICHTSKVEPIILLNKIDLISKVVLTDLLNQLAERIPDVPVIAISNETQAGYEVLREKIIKGKTYCLLGSSGVGKSTLLNNISGKEMMSTGAISTSANRGKHVTSHRELIVLENGGIWIDNPGLRSVGIADSSEGLEMTFASISLLAENCKFNNCSHLQEKGCAILAAIDNEELDAALYANYQKMMRESAHFEANVAERRKKEKDFSKMVKKSVKAKKRFRD